MASQSPLSSILLASDFPMLRESLKACFDGASGIELAGCAHDQSEVLPLVASLQPGVVLLDLGISWTDVCELLGRIHSNSASRSLVMADGLDNVRVIEALQHGAHGVVARRTTPGLLIKSIETVLAGDFWVSRAIVTDLIQMLRKQACVRKDAAVESVGELRPESGAASVAAAGLGLTRRERQIIDTVVEGQTNRDIAATLGISEYTVKHHLTNIFDKLGVYNRVELVLYAIRAGLSLRPAAH